MKVVRGSKISYVPASHEDPRNPGSLKRVLLSKDDFFPGRVQMVNWAMMQPGKSFRRHYHEDMAEVFLVVRGRALMKAGSQSEEIAPGDLAMILPKEEHEMHTVGAEPVEFIVFGVSSEQNGKTIVVGD